MPKLDYARIAQLERELGIGDHSPRRLARRHLTVCLIKNCDGEDVGFITWSGETIHSIHRH